jgi:hypothetical protein
MAEKAPVRIQDRLGHGTHHLSICIRDRLGHGTTDSGGISSRDISHGAWRLSGELPAKTTRESMSICLNHDASRLRGLINFFFRRKCILTEFVPDRWRSWFLGGSILSKASLIMTANRIASSPTFEGLDLKFWAYMVALMS